MVVNMNPNWKPLVNQTAKKIIHLKITLILIFEYITRWSVVQESSYQKNSTYIPYFPPFLISGDVHKEKRQMIFVIFWLGLGFLFCSRRWILNKYDDLFKKVPIHWQFFLVVILYTAISEFYALSVAKSYVGI